MLKKFSALTLDTELATFETITKFAQDNVFSDVEFAGTERQRVGFAPITDASPELFVEGEAQTALAVRFKVGVKSPDSSTVKELVKQRMDAQKEKGLKPKKATIKSEVEVELLPKTQPKFSSFLVIFDFKNKICYTENDKAHFDNLKTKLRDVYASSPFGRILAGKFTDLQMTGWLKGEDTLPTGFKLGDSVQLTVDGESKAKFDNVELLESDAVESFVADGGVVSKIALLYGNMWGFTLDGKGSIAGLKSLAYTDERIEDVMGEEKNQIAEMQTRLVIATSDFYDIIKNFTDLEAK